MPGHTAYPSMALAVEARQVVGADEVGGEAASGGMTVQGDASDRSLPEQAGDGSPVVDNGAVSQRRSRWPACPTGAGAGRGGLFPAAHDDVLGAGVMGAVATVTGIVDQ